MGKENRKEEGEEQQRGKTELQEEHEREEREKEKKRYLTAQAETGQMVSTLSYDLSEARLFIKNLRARVEALPPVPPNGSVLGHRFSDDRLIWRSEVIALLEEEDRD